MGPTVVVVKVELSRLALTTQVDALSISRSIHAEALDEAKKRRELCLPLSLSLALSIFLSFSLSLSSDALR
jgi:hypothetical protein